jgi:hypothetical protein
MIYDAARQEIVLFGGGGNGVEFNDTWVWDGTNWTQKFPVISPPNRDGSAVTYDSIRQEVVLFGGFVSSIGPVGDTWTWNGTTWLKKAPLTTPEARYFAGMAFDSVNGKAVLFGGNGSNSVLGDTWLWDGTNWTSANPTESPQPRYSPAMSYDAARSEVVLFGGALSDNTVVDETWIWNGNSWRRRFPATSPPARLFAGITFNAATSQVFLFGGDSNAFTHILLNDSWVWSQGAVLTPRLFFDGANDPRFFNATFGEPVIDSAGRLILASTHFSTLCTGPCGVRLNSISTGGVLSWQKPNDNSFITSDLLFSAVPLTVSPTDKIYLQGRTTIFAFDSEGATVSGWPVDVIPINSPGPSRFPFGRRGLTIDNSDGTVFAMSAVFSSFSGFPSTIVALRSDGTPKWRRDYSEGGLDYGIIQGPAGNIYSILDNGSGFPFLTRQRFIGIDRVLGTEYCQNPVGGEFGPIIAFSNSFVGGPEGVFGSFHSGVTAFDGNCGSQNVFTSAGPEIVLYRFAEGKIFGYDYPAGSLDANQIRIIALSSSGSLLWRNPVILPGGTTDPIRAVRNGVLYVIGQDTTDANDQKLFLVNSSSGEILNSVSTKPFCISCGIAVASDGTIYLNDLSSTKIFKLN